MGRLLRAEIDPGSPSWDYLFSVVGSPRELPRERLLPEAAGVWGLKGGAASGDLGRDIPALPATSEGCEIGRGMLAARFAKLLESA